MRPELFQDADRRGIEVGVHDDDQSIMCRDLIAGKDIVEPTLEEPHSGVVDDGDRPLGDRRCP